MGTGTNSWFLKKRFLCCSKNCDRLTSPSCYGTWLETESSKSLPPPVWCRSWKTTEKYHPFYGDMFPYVSICFLVLMVKTHVPGSIVWKTMNINMVIFPSALWQCKIRGNVSCSFIVKHGDFLNRKHGGSPLPTLPKGSMVVSFADSTMPLTITYHPLTIFHRETPHLQTAKRSMPPVLHHHHCLMWQPPSLSVDHPLAR